MLRQQAIRASGGACGRVSSAVGLGRRALSALGPSASSASQPQRNTAVSVLTNGLTVASTQTQGHFVTVGVAANVGAAFESPSFKGASHLLDRLAFKSTASMPAAVLLQAAEAVGGNIGAHSSRESIMYQASVFPKHLPETVEILAATVKEPLFLSEELDSVKQQIAYEIDAMQWNYGALLPERLHQLAFGSKLGNSPDKYSIQKVRHANDIPNLCIPSSQLGNQLYCDDPMRLSKISPKILKDFHSLWFTPDRLVVAGVGMPHDQLVELAEKNFGAMKPATPEIKQLQKLELAIAAQTKYTGGICVVDTTGQPVSPNPDDRLLTHVYIAFEAPGMLDPDVYAMATLSSLLGGGGSFSAGGPGKGMYTRLYTEVLNRYHWVESCNTLSFSYQPTSLFGITASVPPSPETHAHILPIMLSHFHQSTSAASLSQVALSRAKNQLKSNLLMSLESRTVELEDVARQVMAQQGTRVDVGEMCRRVDSVTADDIARVAQRMFMGVDCQSPFKVDGDEGVLQHWKRTGDGGPTVIAHGPMFGDRDAMYLLDERVREWGLGGDAFLKSGMKGGNASASVASRQGSGFGRALGSRLFGRNL
ncbi:Mitochondrial-processing peptidase subunit alpha [Physocladia obscura]|uniref:Alpha-MPP n=1 Tax=Physocladia obscura TaxID=109957 RepID=A0AAD5T7E5_9FUNG|nr:Mitochondrial-processing peptidase subunit alpha [Physocladia obscura]